MPRFPHVFVCVLHCEPLEQGRGLAPARSEECSRRRGPAPQPRLPAPRNQATLAPSLTCRQHRAARDTRRSLSALGHDCLSQTAG